MFLRSSLSLCLGLSVVSTSAFGICLHKLNSRKYPVGHAITGTAAMGASIIAVSAVAPKIGRFYQLRMALNESVKIVDGSLSKHRESELMSFLQFLKTKYPASDLDIEALARIFKFIGELESGNLHCKSFDKGFPVHSEDLYEVVLRTTFPLGQVHSDLKGQMQQNEENSIVHQYFELAIEDEF